MPTATPQPSDTANEDSDGDHVSFDRAPTNRTTVHPAAPNDSAGRSPAYRPVTRSAIHSGSAVRSQPSLRPSVIELDSDSDDE